jgi:hypothetical protein
MRILPAISKPPFDPKSVDLDAAWCDAGARSVLSRTAEARFLKWPTSPAFSRNVVSMTRNRTISVVVYRQRCDFNLLGAVDFSLL